MTSLNTIILGLSIAYALIGVLLLGACIDSRLPLLVKVSVILVTGTFYIVSFFGTRALLGWSSVDPLPAHFKLLGARIVEPHSRAIRERSIFGWRRSMTTIVQAAFRAPIAYLTPRSSPKGPKQPYKQAQRQAAGGRSHGRFRHWRRRCLGTDGARSNTKFHHDHQRR
jgi:hypothetical protein